MPKVAALFILRTKLSYRWPAFCFLPPSFIFHSFLCLSVFPLLLITKRTDVSNLKFIKNSLLLICHKVLAFTGNSVVAPFAMKTCLIKVSSDGQLYACGVKCWHHFLLQGEASLSPHSLCVLTACSICSCTHIFKTSFYSRNPVMSLSFFLLMWIQFIYVKVYFLLQSPWRKPALNSRIEEKACIWFMRILVDSQWFWESEALPLPWM